MYKITLLFALCLFSLFASLGCDPGQAPPPMNDDQLKSALDKLPPQDQINYIKGSPMPQAEKDRRIREIEEKTGHKDTNPAPVTPGR